MRLNQLKFLVELKKHRTISETAKQLYISQPSLSTAIKELEDELGFAIIERSNKGVRFTERGELVLKYSRDALQAISEIERLGKNREQTHKSYLSIASVHYVFGSIVMDAFLELKEQYPDLTVTMKEENSYDIVKMLANKEIDFGLVMISNLEEMSTQQELERNNLEFYKMQDEQMYFVVGPKNPLYGKESATMQEILQFPFLTRRRMLNQFNEDVLRQYNENLEILQIDEGDTFLRYLSTSRAVTVLPGCSVRHNVRNIGVDLHAVRAQDFTWTSKIGWLYPKNEALSVEEERFVTLLEEKRIQFNQE